jgi:hypothetical protein
MLIVPVEEAPIRLIEQSLPQLANVGLSPPVTPKK